MKRDWWMRPVLLFALAVLAFPGAAAAQDRRFDLGARAILTGADGEPANDIPGYGAFGHYRFNDRWSLGLAVDRTRYDFEQPARVLGLEQDPDVEVIDAKAEATVVSAWLQRDHHRPRTTWFWGVGLGFASLDVPDAAGPLKGPGTFDIETEADTEILASVLAGLQWRLGERWFLEFALRGDQHFADWRLRDRVSGRTAAIGDYRAFGGHLGAGFRF